MTLGRGARWVWILVVPFAWAPPVPAARSVAEDDGLRVEVHVTSVVAGQLYLDAGREAGLEPGDRVRLLPPGAAPVQATVLSVSSSSARARLSVRT